MGPTSKSPLVGSKHDGSPRPVACPLALHAFVSVCHTVCGSQVFLEDEMWLEAMLRAARISHKLPTHLSVRLRLFFQPEVLPGKLLRLGRTADWLFNRDSTFDCSFSHECQQTTAELTRCQPLFSQLTISLFKLIMDHRNVFKRFRSSPSLRGIYLAQNSDRISDRKFW